MNKWYQSLLREISRLGSRIFIYDPYGLLKDMNFKGDLSKEYAIHEFLDESDFYLFLNQHSSDNVIIYSKANVQRDYIKSNFIELELSLDSIFPDLDVEVLYQVDVCYYQQIFSYYHELKSHNQSIDTQQLILKSVWDIDLGELYSPTNNLKIALSYLIDDKEIPDSISNLISEKLSINIINLKNDMNLLNNWLEDLIKDYILAIVDKIPPKYDLSNNLIQFYLFKVDNPFRIEITDRILEKEPWLAKFQSDITPELQKNQIEAEILTFNGIFEEFQKEEEFDLNRLDDLFVLSKTFCHILYQIQINDWSLDEFLDLESYYLSLNHLFKKLLIGGKFESLFRYPYHQKPYTVDRVLHYVNHNFKEDNIALIVFDGMSYDEWFILKANLQHFNFEETESFAILPTITSFSRTSIFSGKVPREFMIDNKIPQKTEKNGFYSFLTSKGYPENDILFGRIDLNDNIIKTDSELIEFKYLKGYKFIGLICSLFDDISHETSIYGEVKSNLYKNLKNGIESSQIVQLLEKLKDLGYKIVITTDHGNIFSKSNGIKPNKNLEFERRKSNRCLIFDNELFADSLISQHPEKCYKYNYNIIPSDLTLVFPESNNFFSTRSKYTITHGGIMPEEWIVPVVILK